MSGFEDERGNLSLQMKIVFLPCYSPSSAQNVTCKSKQEVQDWLDSVWLLQDTFIVTKTVDCSAQVDYIQDSVEVIDTM